MRINYNILWVEDNRGWYETTKELFEELMEDLGFKLFYPHFFRPQLVVS